MKHSKKKLVLKFSKRKLGKSLLITIIGSIIAIVVYLTLTVYADTSKKEPEVVNKAVTTASLTTYGPKMIAGITYMNFPVDFPTPIIVEPTISADWYETSTVEETTEATTEEITESSTIRPINGYDINRRSGFTAEEFNEIIAKTLSNVGHTDSAFYGAGQALKDVEDVYNINGLFLLGIGSEESAWGTYGPAKRRNNYMGMGPVKNRASENGRAIFNSTYDCFWCTGRNLRENYFNSSLTSIYSVGYKYCSPTAEEWADNVTSHMNKYRNAAINLYGEDVFE